MQGNLILKPEIDWAICQACDHCEARSVCNMRAIVIIDPGDPPYIDYSRCSGCADCVTACTYSAVYLKNSLKPSKVD